MSQPSHSVSDYLKAIVVTVVILGGNFLLSILVSPWVTLGRRLGDLFSTREVEKLRVETPQATFSNFEDHDRIVEKQEGPHDKS